MIELLLGFVFLALMFMPFTFGEQMADSELSSLGLIILGLALLAYFNNFFLPLPLVINEGLVASVAIIDALFQVFFGQNIAAFGGVNLIIFLISLSISYSLLKIVFFSLPMLSERASEFITLAVLFVIARTTVTGGVNLIYILGLTIINVLLPNCSATGLSFSLITSIVVGILLIVIPFIILPGTGMKILLFLAGIGFIFISMFRSLLPEFLSFQVCIYGWVVQLAMIMFLINTLIHAIAVDWMVGIQEAMKEETEE